MPNNRNTVTENPPLDAEDWEIALEPYQANHGAALTLGFNLMVLKAYLTVKPLKIQDAIEGIDQAMVALYQHTEFRYVSYLLFRRLAEGQLTSEEEKILESLNVKF
jgi:hypothetical protein